MSTARSSAAPRSTPSRSRRSAAPRSSEPRASVAARHARRPRRLGHRPARARQRGRARAHAGLRRPLRALPHDAARRVRRRGRAAGRPDGQLRGRASDDRLRPDPLPGPRARQPRRRGRRVLREPRAHRRLPPGAASAAAQVHLLGLVSTGGVHSHIDHLRALLELARREGMGERTWIHAFTDGRDVSPHAAVDRPRDAARGADRDRRRPLLRDGPRRALGANATARSRRSATAWASAADDPVEAVRASYERGVTDEFVEPVVLARPAAARPGAGRRDRLQLPARPGPPAHRAAARRGRRRRDDDALPRRLRLPGRVRGAAGARHARRGARGRRPRAAPRGRDREVRPRHVLLQRRHRGALAGRGRGSSCPRRGTSRATTSKPEMSAAEVAARGRRGARRRPTASASSTSRTPTWSATPASSRPSFAPSRPSTRASATVVDATHRPGGVCLVTADHGNAEKMLEDDGVSPHTAHTTNPVPLVLTLEGGAPARRRRALRPRTDGPRPARSRRPRR